jgi:hypothetical protein
MRKTPNGFKGLNASLDEQRALMQHSRTVSDHERTVRLAVAKQPFDVLKPKSVE